jgi:diguanylate cyclase (GGDEF)-like protein
MILRFLLCLLLFGPGIGAAQAADSLPNPLKIVISNDTFPYMYTDEQGQPAGLVVDYWLEVAKRQQVQVQFVMADWPETLGLLKRGDVHLHGGIAYNEERARNYQLGDTGIEIYSNVFMQRDMPTISKLSQLKPFAIGVVDKSSHVATLQQLIPDVILKAYPTVTAMYDAALAGDVNVLSGLDRLPPRYGRYDELIRQFPLYRKIPLRNIDLSYAVSKNNPLFAVLQQATSQIGQTFLDRLERRWLGLAADDDTLLLGLAIDNPPYMHVSLQGEAQGLFVDLWRHWSELTGVKIAFVPDSSFNNLQNLKKGRIDALIGFPDNNRLPQGVVPAYQLYGFQSQFFAPVANQSTPLTAASTVKIGVFDNAAYVDELRQRFPNVDIVYYRHLTEMVNASVSGELAGFYAASAIVPLRLQQLDRADYFSAQEDSKIVSPIYSLVRSDKPELAEQIRQGFSRFTLDSLIQIEQKWVTQDSLHYFPQFRQQTPLTERESEWLQAHPKLRFGMLTDWAPMEFVDDHGDPAGVTVDMLQLLQQRMELQFSIQTFNSFDVMLEALKQKHIDLIANVSEREERKAFARFTDEFWSTQWAVIGPSNAANIVSASELAGKKVAIYKDYQLAQHLTDTYPTISVVKVESLRDGFELLQQSKVEFVLDSVEAASEMLRQAGYLYLKIQILEDLPAYPSLIAVRDDYAPLVVILNKGLRSIGKEERQQLYQKWFSLQVTQGLNKAQLRQLIWQIGGAAALLLAFVVIWNLSLRREVSLRRQAEQKMRFMATHDDLTKLPNRSLIKERIEQALLQHARHNEALALLFIDLDGFKDINDRYGHDAGDELLLALAKELSHTVRKSDTVARFGGDEFVILLTGLLSRDDAAIVAEKILHRLSQPITLTVGDVKVGASIGIAVYPDDGTDSARLLKVADNLMYRIKQQGKNQYCFSRAVNS